MKSSRAARSAAPSTSRRTSTVVMIIGTVIALAAAFGPIWAVRIGLVVAIAAAVFAIALAWREVARQRRQHASVTAATNKAHAATLKSEREHNAEVLKVVTDRNTRAIADLGRQQTEIAGLRSEVSGLRGDKVALTAKLAAKDATIGTLRSTIAVREAELAAVLNEGTDESDAAQVHAMPRRVLVGTGDAEVPDADDLWSDGSHPTVVDLAMVDVPALPNYEEDRKLA